MYAPYPGDLTTTHSFTFFEINKSDNTTYFYDPYVVLYYDSEEQATKSLLAVIFGLVVSLVLIMTFKCVKTQKLKVVEPDTKKSKDPVTCHQLVSFSENENCKEKNVNV